MLRIVAHGSLVDSTAEAVHVKNDILPEHLQHFEIDGATSMHDRGAADEGQLSSPPC